MRWSYALRIWSLTAAVVACVVGRAAQDAAGESTATEPAEQTATEPAEQPATPTPAFDAMASVLPSFDPLSGGQAGQFLFYSGVDIWRFGFAGYGGVQWAPGKLDNEGFILRLIVSDGLERYNAGSNRSSTQIFRASLLPGWKFKRGSFEVQFLLGPDFEIDSPYPDVPTARLRGTHFGARGSADFWWEPIPPMMLAASLSGTTIANAYSARGAAGWRLLDRFWTGPEIAASGDDFSQQYRVGIHLTGFRTAEFEWSAAAGYVQDSFNRSGAYGRLGVLLRR